MFKNISKFAVAALIATSALSAPSFSYAEEEANKFEVKTFAVVDVKRIVDESTAAKTAEKEVNALKDKYLAEIKGEEEKLKARQKELIDQKKALSEEALATKVKEFQAKIQQEQQNALKKKKIIEAAYIKSLELIRDETLKVVAEIAKEKKIELVVPTSQLLYSRDGLDISDEVLELLNKKLTKVDINVKKD